MALQRPRSGPSALARLCAVVLFLPAWPLASVAAWRARRRLRAYGPAAVLQPDHFARLRLR